MIASKYIRHLASKIVGSLQKSDVFNKLWNSFITTYNSERPLFWSGNKQLLRELTYPDSAENETLWLETGELWVSGYILHKFPSPPQDSWHVVEIGCGPGRLFSEMAKQFQLVIGVDFSLDMVNYARKLLNNFENIRVLHNDGLLLPFEDSTIDFIYSVLVFQHMSREAIESNFSEIYRVLKSDGVFRFQTRWDLDNRESSNMDRYYLSKRDVAKIAKQYGFEIVDYQYGLGHPLFHWFTLIKPDINK